MADVGLHLEFWQQNKYNVHDGFYLSQNVLLNLALITDRFATRKSLSSTHHTLTFAYDDPSDRVEIFVFFEIFSSFRQ